MLFKPKLSAKTDGHALVGLYQSGTALRIHAAVILLFSMFSDDNIRGD